MLRFSSSSCVDTSASSLVYDPCFFFVPKCHTTGPRRNCSPSVPTMHQPFVVRFIPPQEHAVTTRKKARSTHSFEHRFKRIPDFCHLVSCDVEHFGLLEFQRSADHSKVQTAVGISAGTVQIRCRKKRKLVFVVSDKCSFNRSLVQRTGDTELPEKYRTDSRDSRTR